jgi:hypothetical protein
MDQTKDRGTGRTTSQIYNAPLNAVYVCKTHSFIRYCADIAVKVGREDLRFFCADHMKNGYLRGLDLPVVFDHDCAAAYPNLKAA